MARTEDIRALEADCPWEQPQFRAGLASLGASTAAAARTYAADARVLAGLAAQVPRCPADETGATPWTSFRREVAVARSVSDQAAAGEIRAALRLTSVLTTALGLLESGVLTVPRAKVLLSELEPYPDELAAQVDAELAAQIARLAPWRIEQVVRRAVLVLDPDAAARRCASATAGRGVSLLAQPDGQASVFLTGPAVPLVRWFGTLDDRARGLRAAGDSRTLDALRFDLATSTWPCATHPPVDPTTAGPDAASAHGTSAPGAEGPARRATAEPAPRAAAPSEPVQAEPVQAEPVQAEPVQADPVQADPVQADPVQADPVQDAVTGVEPASTDCRLSRPVQAIVVVPVETALGLSNEPGWLDGYGWLDAATSRLLLPDAELRRLCARTSTGQPVDLSPDVLRPPPTPTGVRSTLLDMVQSPAPVSDTVTGSEPQHDPSDRLRRFVTVRDRHCDGPTHTRTPASRCELDHQEPYPQGPTAAWNLVARATRTHQLKHYGWTPVRTATSTLWTSPSGQLVDVPRPHTPPPGVDADLHQPPALPDADQLAAIDREQLAAPDDDDLPPWLPASERVDLSGFSRLDGSDEPPF